MRKDYSNKPGRSPAENKANIKAEHRRQKMEFGALFVYEQKKGV
jgi:hypothetical protein